MSVSPFGRTLIALAFSVGVLQSHEAAAQLVADATFGVGGQTAPHMLGPHRLWRVALQTDGKIVVVGGGDAALATATDDFIVIRFNSNGTPDQSFGPDGIRTIDFSGGDDEASSVAIQADGKIVVAGGSVEANGFHSGFAITRLLPTGEIDTSFGVQGRVVSRFGTSARADTTSVCLTLGPARGLAIQPDGRIVVVGNAFEEDQFFQFSGTVPAIARYNTDGSADATFLASSSAAGSCPNTTGIHVVSTFQFGSYFGGFSDVVAEPDGRLIVGGFRTSSVGVVGRVNSNGSLMFLDDYPGTVSDIERLPDGRVLFTRFNGFLNRLTNQLLPDPTFGSGGSISIPVAEHSMAVGIDGVIYVNDAGLLRRFTAPGVLLDMTPRPVRNDMVIQPDGRAVIVGAVQVGSEYGVSLVRFAAATVSLLTNGTFSGQLGGWTAYGAPSLDVMQHNSGANGVFEFWRNPPPGDTANQATVFQETFTPLAASVPLVAQFDLGNSSTVRKRISVLILAHDFSDLSVCTFWLPPQSALATYRMRTHTTLAWSNAAIYFYAATTGEFGGRYQLDNVSLHVDPAGSATRTECADPLAPTPSAGASSGNLVENGDFSAPFALPWFVDGNLISRVNAGVFEFHRVAPALPAGVVANLTGGALTARQVLTATFQLGNASTIRQRITVILGANDFSDLSACTFWLAAGQPLSMYVMRTFTTIDQANHLVSVYAATVANHPWMQLDNVTLQTTPASATSGTECVEPGDAESTVMAIAVLPPATGTAAVPSARGGTTATRTLSILAADGWVTFPSPGGTLYFRRMVADSSGEMVRLPCDVQSSAPIELHLSVDDGPPIATVLPPCGMARWILIDARDPSARTFEIAVWVRDPDAR